MNKENKLIVNAVMCCGIWAIAGNFIIPTANKNYDEFTFMFIFVIFATAIPMLIIATFAYYYGYYDAKGMLKTK